MGTDEDLTKATKIAIQEMIDFLVAEKKLDKMTAYQLTSIAGDVAHHAARGRQGRRAREDAQGDFQMKLAHAFLRSRWSLPRSLPRGRPPPSPPTPADFGPVGTPAAPTGERGGLSPDGRWLAYGINRTNGENELRVASIADGATKTIAFGAQPVFSADSRWLAVSVGYSEAQQDKMRKDKKPIRRKLALVNLASGVVTTHRQRRVVRFQSPTAVTC